MTRPPNWERILQSEIWQEEILPWISEMAQDALEEKATSTIASLDTYHHWRGYVAALIAVRDMPSEMHEIDRTVTQQENEDAGRRNRAGTNWLNRRRGRG